MQRFARIAGSFAIVLVAYWLYAHTAVPLIEPSIKGADAGASGEETPVGQKPADDVYLKQLRGLFAAGQWELDKPMILDINNRAKLLLREYENLQDGRVKLRPCTMVFLYDGPAENDEERQRQSVVLEAPEGAIVKFDSPLDPKRLKIGRPVGGHLQGPITIRSNGKSPGPEDDLRIHARDLIWDGLNASSEQPVDFQWGKNAGRGRGLHIKLLPAEPGAIANNNGPNVSGVEVFEIKKIENLHLEGDPNRPAGDANSSTVGAPAADQNPFAAGGEMGPIEITCLGAFRFHVIKREASFENHVELRQLHPGGPADQLLGDRLALYFAPRGKERVATSDSSLDLEPERLEALGKPVTIFSPQKKFSAQGESVAYNLKTKRIKLDGGPEVFIKQDGNEIHGKSLEYQQNLSSPKALGLAWVKGPGYLRGAQQKQPDQIFEARWNGELNVSPKDGHQVIAITGGAELNYSGFGKMTAEKIYFWFLETPAGPAGETQFKPAKMNAINNVTVDSPQMSGTVGELKVWFERKDSPSGIRWETDAGAAKKLTVPIKAETPSNIGQPGQTSPRPLGQGPSEGPSLGAPMPNASPGGPNASHLVPPNTNIPVRYLGQQLPVRTAYRQPLFMPRQPQTNPPPLYNPAQPMPQPRQAVPAAVAPAVVRPINAPAANRMMLTPVQNRGVVANPFTSPQPPQVQPNPNAPPLAAVPEKPRQHFKIQGRLVEAQVLLKEPSRDLSEQQAELTNLRITDGVRFEETQTSAPNEKPLLLVGDKLEAVNLEGMNAASSTARVVVLGQPAQVEGHNLRLSGSNIRLDSGANRLWIEGPGNMELPMPDNFNGQPIAVPGTLTVRWAKGMEFDGKSAFFNEKVEAATPQMKLWTETLEVRLKQPIRFSDPHLQDRRQPDASQLICCKGVLLENHGVDMAQRPTSFDRLQVTDLNIDLQSGELTAGGPGWLNSVSLNNDESLQRQGIFVPIRAPAPPTGSAVPPVVRPQATSKLVGLHVRFQGSIMGNFSPGRQRIDFNDQVCLLYAPVNDWPVMLNPDKEPLETNEVRLACDSLEVRRMQRPNTKDESVELDAQGNSVVHGVLTDNGKDVMYTAREQRISYNTAKDQLILEGDGRTDVHLYRQYQIGAPLDDTAMKKIIFYPKTNYIDMQGIQTLQINQLTPNNNK